MVLYPVIFVNTHSNVKVPSKPFPGKSVVRRAETVKPKQCKEEDRKTGKIMTLTLYFLSQGV